MIHVPPIRVRVRVRSRLGLGLGVNVHQISSPQAAAILLAKQVQPYSDNKKRYCLALCLPDSFPGAPVCVSDEYANPILLEVWRGLGVGPMSQFVRLAMTLLICLMAALCCTSCPGAVYMWGRVRARITVRAGSGVGTRFRLGTGLGLGSTLW